MKTTTVVRLYSLAVMLVCGVVAYTCFTQPLKTTERPQEIQETLYANIPTVTPGPPPRAASVKNAEALASLRIPRFGKNWMWTVSEGTSLDVLDNGPGHFTGTALPGERGNTAYAAHRAGHGDPFLNFETLRPGDEVIIAQNGAEWVYEVTLIPRVIEPNEGWVVKNFEYGRWMTLTTCWPKYGSEKRMYVRAKLKEVN